MTSAAPARAIMSPSQKIPRSFSRRRKTAANATHNGAVFPSKVAFAAVVYFNDEFHNAKSQAVKRPAANGKGRYCLEMQPSFRCCRTKSGVSKIVEKDRR